MEGIVRKYIVSVNCYGTKQGFDNSLKESEG